jgi:hypothetical protein
VDRSDLDYFTDNIWRFVYEGSKGPAAIEIGMRRPVPR